MALNGKRDNEYRNTVEHDLIKMFGDVILILV